MICASYYRNPLSPKDRVTMAVPAGRVTLRSLTRALNEGGEYWPVPVVALVDGVPWMRARWDDTLGDERVVEFRAMLRGGGGMGGRLGALVVDVAIGGIGTAAIMGLSMVGTMANGFGAGIPQGALNTLQMYGSYGLISGLAKPGVPSYLGGDSGSPVYSIDGKGNRKRVGEPIPVLYGHHQLLPDMIAAPYVYYDGDDQYLVSVLCLGIGDFAVDTTTLRFGEAKFGELDAIQYQIAGPGVPLTLAHDHVTTSSAVNGQTLTGPSPAIQLQAAPTLTLTAVTSGGFHLTIVSSLPIFDPVIVGDTLVLAGTPTNDGSWVVDTTTSSTSVRVTLVSAGTTETATAAHITRQRGGTADLPLSTLPGALTFLGGGTNSISSATGAGAFNGLHVGDSIVVTNTVSNNATFTVRTMASDLSSITTNEPLIGETATNADIAFASDGWVGWFEVATANDTITSIEVDLVCARGIGSINGDGSVAGRTITITVQYQGLDSTGAPAGSVLSETLTLTGAQQKAMRRSFSWSNGTGYARVQARARRTTAPSTASTALDDAALAGLKGYMADVGTYPGVTTMLVVAKASEQLSGQQSGQINLEATRKIPIWNGTTWSANTATTSIAWALADILKAGAGLTDDEIDLPALLALDAVWAGRGDSFNGVFDQGLTIWEATTRTARAGRAQPVLSGGVVTFVRDGANTTRVAMFSPSQILPGSLGITYALPQDGDPDGTSVSWIDPSTWQAAHIDYSAAGGSPVNPTNVDLFGVTNLAQANREVTYLDRVRIYQRKTITFKTEMDGHLVSVGDLIAVSHDVPAWGQSADLIDITAGTYTCSDPLTWTPLATHYVLLRKPDGSVAGPFAVLQVTDHPEQFTFAGSIGFTARTYLDLGDRTSVQFGPGLSAITQDCVVTAVTPQDSVTVEIQCVPYDARIHAAGA